MDEDIKLAMSATSLLWIVFIIILLVMVDLHEETYAEREAVKHHGAQWVTTPDGTTVFKWNDEIKAEK